MKSLTLYQRQAIVLLAFVVFFTLGLLLLFAEQLSFSLLEFICIKAIGFGLIAVALALFKALVTP